MVQISSGQQFYRFDIKPNCSLSRTGAMVFFIGVAVFSLLVAMRFVLMGAWPVLLMTLIELIALAICMKLVLKATHRRESVVIRGDEVVVSRHEEGKTHEAVFNCYWVQIHMQTDPRKWYPARLLLRSHGKQIEVGQFLTEDEREELALDINLALRNKINNPVLDAHKANS